MLGCESAVCSLGTDHDDPAGVPIVALFAPLKVSAKLSEALAEASSVIGTSTVFAVSPGRKVSVPEASL